MKTVVLDVRAPSEAMADFVRVWKAGKKEKAARRVGRDVKAVHTDVTAPLNAGVLDRVKDGRVIFPFDSVKVEFLLRAA